MTGRKHNSQVESQVNLQFKTVTKCLVKKVARFVARLFLKLKSLEETKTLANTTTKIWKFATLLSMLPCPDKLLKLA